MGPGSWVPDEGFQVEGPGSHFSGMPLKACSLRLQHRCFPVRFHKFLRTFLMAVSRRGL